MSRHHPLAWMTLVMLFFSACGPDTIFLRPSLDTPAQHVKNGRCLLDRGKTEAAYDEFLRAKNLDAQYAPAYVGIALVQGARGDVTGGLETLARARSLADSPEEMETVAAGEASLKGMQPRVDE